VQQRDCVDQAFFKPTITAQLAKKPAVLQASTHPIDNKQATQHPINNKQATLHPINNKQTSNAAATIATKHLPDPRPQCRCYPLCFVSCKQQKDSAG
jgi:hypothetical protein